MATRTKKPYRWPGLHNRAPKSGWCSICHTSILIGEYDSFPVHLDAQQLDPRGEAEAWIRGLPTYHAVPPHLYKRSVATIEELWNPTFGAIYRTHRCGAPPPSYVKPTPARPSDEPGF